MAGEEGASASEGVRGNCVGVKHLNARDTHTGFKHSRTVHENNSLSQFSIKISFSYCVKLLLTTMGECRPRFHLLDESQTMPL